MARSGKGVRAGRKAMTLFLAAILLPSLVVAVFGWFAIAKRHDAVRTLARNSLYAASEALLERVENTLIEEAGGGLRIERFQALPRERADLAAMRTREAFPFLLDEDFRMLYPLRIGEPIRPSGGGLASDAAFFSAVLRRRSGRIRPRGRGFRFETLRRGGGGIFDAGLAGAGHGRACPLPGPVGARRRSGRLVAGLG